MCVRRGHVKSQPASYFFRCFCDGRGSAGPWRGPYSRLRKKERRIFFGIFFGLGDGKEVVDTEVDMVNRIFFFERLEGEGDSIFKIRRME